MFFLSRTARIGVQLNVPMTYELKCDMHAPVPLAEVFKFFENPRNLARITPPELSFSVTTPGEIKMRKGAQIDYTIRWLGLPMRWRTLITDYTPPFSFVDEQAKGPYTLWRHCHEFREVEGGTVISDCVHYELPLGPLGRIAHELMVGNQLRRIFSFRQRAIAKILAFPGIRFTDPVIGTLVKNR